LSVFDPAVRERVIKSHEEAAEAAEYLDLLERYFRKHIERARRFSWSLTVPAPNAEIRYVVMGGDCIPTPARAVVEPIESDWALRLAPNEIRRPLPAVDYDLLMLEPGDGTVTKALLLARNSTDPTIARHAYSDFPVDYPIFLCERHSQLTGNIDLSALIGEPLCGSPTGAGTARLWGKRGGLSLAPASEFVLAIATQLPRCGRSRASSRPTRAQPRK